MGEGRPRWEDLRAARRERAEAGKGSTIRLASGLLKKRPVSFHETLGLFESPKKNLMPAHAHLSKKELESLSFGSLNEKLDSQSVESTGEGMLLLINGTSDGSTDYGQSAGTDFSGEGWNLRKVGRNGAAFRRLIRSGSDGEVFPA